MGRIYIGTFLRRKKYLAVLLFATSIIMVGINKGLTALGNQDSSKRVNNTGLAYHNLSGKGQDSPIHREARVITNHSDNYDTAPAAKAVNIYIAHGPVKGSASAVAQASKPEQNSTQLTLASRNGGVNNSEKTLQRNGTSNNKNGSNNNINNNNKIYDHKSDKNQVFANFSMTTPSLHHSNVLNEHNGFRNAETVNRKCLEMGLNNINTSRVSVTVRWSKGNDVLYCPTYKIGTTFWRRVFMIQREGKYRGVVNPYSIPSNTEYLASKITLGNATLPAFKFMFTRNIYTRLFSFYIDKLYVPNYYFWNTVGIKAVKLQHGNHVRNATVCRQVTFPELIKYVIHTLTTGKDVDPHWIPIEHNCRPCQLKYDFIGRQESFSADSELILEQLGLSKTAYYLKHNGRDAAEEDAITDALNQALTPERRVIRKSENCMNFETKVVLAWQKLQIKGLVGGDSLDSAVIGQLKKLTRLNERARQSRMLYTKSQRGKYKDEMYRQYWKQISDSDKLKLQELYATEFELFGYDSKLVLN